MKSHPPGVLLLTPDKGPILATGHLWLETWLTWPRRRVLGLGFEYPQISFLGGQEEPAIKFRTNKKHQNILLYSFLHTSDRDCVQSVCEWLLLLSKLIFESFTEDRTGPCVRQGGTQNSFMWQTIPELCRERKGDACWWDTDSCPQLIGYLYPLALCKEPFGSQTHGLFSRVLHQSRILFAPHWLIGSSPPAAVAMSVWVSAKRGVQMCAWWGWGKMLPGASSNSVSSWLVCEKNFPKFAPTNSEDPPFGQWGYLRGLCGEPKMGG